VSSSRSSIWRRIVFLVLATLVPAGAASATSDVGSRTQATVTIGFLNVEPTMQAVYAEARGYFARQGIDVELKPFTDPSLIPAAVLSGEVQFSAFNVGGLANLKARGAPVKLVASGALYRPLRPTTALVVAPGKAITSARGLRGKKIAIDARTTIAHIGLLRWLKRNGIAEDDVTLVEFRGFAPMLGPLRRGQIDAAVLPEPYLTLAPRGARRLAPLFNATCRTDCLITVWMARKDIDGNLAARFRNAIQAGGVWANQERNRAASAAILARQTSLDAAVVRRMARTTFSTRLRPALAQPWIDAYAEFGVIPNSFSAIDLVK
jgi:ABC-type nitrate/sulfonate/bicarbonate transport system substrate-binding protein